MYSRRSFLRAYDPGTDGNLGRKLDLLYKSSGFVILCIFIDFIYHMDLKLLRKGWKSTLFS